MMNMSYNRKALCVGINTFKNYPEFALRGCINDTKDMSNILRRMNFAQTDIKVLEDQQATKKNVMSNLESMVKSAEAGELDHIVWSFSSHGTQGFDKSGDEDDHVDEVFVTHDIKQKGSEWDEDTVISDDECAALFSKIPDKVLLEVFFDTCHSGTGLKAIDLLLNLRKPRFIPPPAISTIEKAEGKRLHKLREALLEKGVKNHVLWAACSDFQTSADANIQGAWHGAFTYYFNKEVIKTPTHSREQILQKVLKGLASGSYGQTPQLECSPDLKRRPIGLGRK
jgi:metacaspase-1